MMSGSTSSPTKKDSSKSQYERKMARQRQLDLMEAAASGTAPPSMSLDVHPNSSTGGGIHSTMDDGASNSSSSNYNQVHRRAGGSKLHDADSTEETLTFQSGNSPTRTNNKQSLFVTTSPTRTKNTNLFDQRGRPDVFPIGSGLNLMDHSTGVYKELTTTERMMNNLRSMFSGGKSNTTTATSTASSLYPEMYDAGMAHQDDFNGGDYIGRHPTHNNGSKRRYHTTYMSRLWNDRRRRYIIFVLIAIAIVVITFISVSKFGYNTAMTTEQQLRNENTQRFNSIMDHIIEHGISHHQKIMNYHSPEHHALRWVAYSDPANLSIDDPMLQVRYALATFFYSSFIAFEKLAGGQQIPLEIGNKQWEGVPNPGWIRKDYWMSEKGICSWYGIHCPEQVLPNARTGLMESVTQYDDNLHPIQFVLHNNHMVGSIVPEVKALIELRTLDLSKNQLTGSIPQTIGRLFQLETLHLSNNYITGHLHGDFGFMERIQDIDIHNNLLSGHVPAEINRLYELESLNLSNNNITGHIPDMISCKKLKSLRFDHNRLGGEFPFSLALHASLTDLYINNNQIKGTIPAEIESIRGLERLHVEFNKISGHIPKKFFSKMSSLREVVLERNAFTGSIPTDMSAMYQLTVLNLGTNQLAGPIPSTIGTISSLQHLHLMENGFTGSLPTTIGQIIGLKELWIQSNKLTSSIPTQLGQCRLLETLFVENNQLTGTISVTVGTIASLKSLRTHTNNLKGKIPAEICDSSNRQHLKFLTSDCKGKVECPKGCCNECY